jgi:CubicO group peptidase (beta-lactamase class C family)
MREPVYGRGQSWITGRLTIVFVFVLTSVLCLLAVKPNAVFASTSYPFMVIDQYDNGFDYVPGEHWARLKDPSQAGWHHERLNNIRDYAKSIGTDALLIIARGAVVLAYGDCDSRLKLHSVRKSLMSVMYGIYNARGVLNLETSLEALGIDDIARLTKTEKQATIANLLTSMSGVYHPAAYETDRMQEKRPPRGAYLPGEFWFYNNWDFNVLVTIFNRNTRRDFFDAFYTDLALPIGMEHFRKTDGQYYFERENSIHPAYLFEMSALDLARIGLLYLRGGNWAGRQILPKEWVDRSTSAIHVWKSSRPKAGYGYMWFVTEEGFYAAGRGGQRLFVLPQQQLVIVHLVDTTGRKRVDNEKIKRLLKMITETRQLQ